MTFQINSSKQTISQSEEKGFRVNTISILFMLYIASTIIFRMQYNSITYIINFVLVGAFLVLFVRRKIKIYNIDSVIVAYFIFSVFALASSLWAKDLSTAMFKSFQLFAILINMFIIYNLSKNYRIVDYFIYGVLLGSFVNYIFALEIIPSFVDIYVLTRFVGTVGNANSLSVVMIISIFVSIIYLAQKKEKHKSNILLYYYQYINIVLALYLIMLSVSRKGIVFGFALVFLQIIVSIKDVKGFIRLSVVGLIGFIVIINFVNLDNLLELYSTIEYRFNVLEEGLENYESRTGSTGIRLHLAKIGLDLFAEHPLIGVGIDNFRLYSGGLYSHSNYIELLASLGLIGFMAFYSIHLIIFKKILQIVNAENKLIYLFFLIVLMGMDFASVSYYNKLIMYTLLIVSLLCSENSNSRNKKYEQKN